MITDFNMSTKKKIKFLFHLFCSHFKTDLEMFDFGNGNGGECNHDIHVI